MRCRNFNTIQKEKQYQNGECNYKQLEIDFGKTMCRDAIKVPMAN